MAFWKRLIGKNEEEHIESSDEFSPESPPPPAPRFSPLSEASVEPSFAHSPFQQASPVSLQSLPQQSPDPELRVISAKLDTIKAVLDVINQRLDRLEGRKSEEFGKWR